VSYAQSQTIGNYLRLTISTIRRHDIEIVRRAPWAVFVEWNPRSVWADFGASRGRAPQL